MAVYYKVLGQVNPTANTLSTVYTVPVGSSTVVSTLTICNQSANATTFDIAVRPSGASIDPKHYVNYRTPLPGSDTISLTLGMTLAANDVVSVNAGSSLVSFNVFGSEIV